MRMKEKMRKKRLIRDILRNSKTSLSDGEKIKENEIEEIERKQFH